MKEKDKSTWFWVTLCIVLIAVGIIRTCSERNGVTETARPATSDAPYRAPDPKVLTLAQAEQFIGMRIKDICPKYGQYNIHPRAEAGIRCSEDVGKGYPFDDYIIVQVYHDEEDTRNPKMIYIESVPEDEARAAGITVK